MGAYLGSWGKEARLRPNGQQDKFRDAAVTVRNSVCGNDHSRLDMVLLPEQ